MSTQNGLTVHFTDGTKLAVSFPEQRDNLYARQIMAEEIMKQKMLVIEGEGAMHFIPFENIKYFTVYPSGDDIAKWVIRGARIEA